MIEVRLYDNESFDAEECPLSNPHRHDHHELFWTTGGDGRHVLDGRPVTAGEHSLILVPRGQVHRFERARGVAGACIRFGAEVLDGLTGPGLLLAAGRPSTVRVAPEDAAPLDSVIHALATDAGREPGRAGRQLRRHLLLAVLAWFDRARPAALPTPPAADAQLVQRFTALLERDFAGHHDVGHYAAALHVSPGTLRRTVSAVTGQPPRRMITDRVLLEGARLLRYTGMTVTQVARAVGLDDPLYFSRSFKRHYGRSPLAYRAAGDPEDHLAG